MEQKCIFQNINHTIYIWPVFFQILEKKILSKNSFGHLFLSFFIFQNLKFHKKMVGVNHLFWIFKSHHLHLTCFFDFFWREMACPKNKNAQEKAVHFFFSTHVPNSILRYFCKLPCWSKLYYLLNKLSPLPSNYHIL